MRHWHKVQALNICSMSFNDIDTCNDHLNETNWELFYDAKIIKHLVAPWLEPETLKQMCSFVCSVYFALYLTSIQSEKGKITDLVYFNNC